VRVLYAFLCEHVQPTPDGRLDVHGIFHQLYAPGFPAKQDHMVLAIALEWDQEGEGRKDFSIDLLDPSRSPCLSITGHTDVSSRNPTEAPPQTRLILPMEEVPFPSEGTYLFELRLGDRSIELTPLHLIASPGE
jgi:hypothetical protein